jgi:SAM-dependent methyltransferase
MPGRRQIIRDVEEYYTGKVTAHGATPQGADWNSEASQTLRFEQLAKVIAEKEGDPFSILDYGCGYGALLDFLKKKYNAFRYAGYDVSEKMIAEARLLYTNESGAAWHHEGQALRPADYVVASGLFNVKLGHGDAAWRNYVIDTLEAMNKLAVKGLAFNLLTAYSDREHMKDYLYYADPAFYFNYCKVNCSRYVALLHDYPLYEFTLLVRK